MKIESGIKLIRPRRAENSTHNVVVMYGGEEEERCGRTKTRGKCGEVKFISFKEAGSKTEAERRKGKGDRE